MAGRQDSDLVTVASYGSESEALVARSRLDAAGIDAMVESHDGGAYPDYQLQMGASVRVRPEDVGRAREVLAPPAGSDRPAGVQQEITDEVPQSTSSGPAGALNGPEVPLMATFTFKGETFHTNGELPRPGDPAPDFRLVTTALEAVSLADFEGYRLVLNIFPSLDTGVCAASVRKFNEEASRFPRAKIVNVSMDLPFAAKRFCDHEGIENVIHASDFRDGSFGRTYGIRIADGPLEGLLARSVVIIDQSRHVAYTELVPETTQEPDYGAALDVAGNHV
ncbi:MAG: thiol peroxidase [Candidatus Krumholzibacteriia bacterium]